MSQLVNTGSSLLSSFYVALNSFMAFLPTLLGAAIVLVVGWVVSSAVAQLLEGGLVKIGFEKVVSRSGINDFIAKSGTTVTMSYVVAQLLKWMIRLIFIQAAANILGMPQVTAIINSIVLFIPKVAVALLIVVLGSLAAGFLSRIVQGSLAEAKIEKPSLFANLTRYSIIGFSVIAAFSQLEVAPVIVNSLFIALISSIALALGLAFGLGGREVAGELTRTWMERGRETTKRIGGAAAERALRDASNPPRRTGTGS